MLDPCTLEDKLRVSTVRMRLLGALFMTSEDDFELLEARTGDVRVEMPWRKDTPWMNPRAVFTSDSGETGRAYAEHISAIIGKNGTGKSHLLSAIAQSFLLLEELQTLRRSKAA